MKMLKGIFAITRGHEVVEMREVEYVEDVRQALELVEGQPMPMYGAYEGCTVELVGIE